MATDKEVGRFAKSAGETIIVRQREFKGGVYVDIRTYFRPDSSSSSENLAPTKKGICVQSELIGDLVELLKSAERKIFG